MLKLLISYKHEWEYNLTEQLWFFKPSFDAGVEQQYFDPKAWQLSPYPHSIMKSDFISIQEFEKYATYQD